MIKKVTGVFLIVVCVLALAGCDAGNVQVNTTDENHTEDGSNETVEKDTESKSQTEQKSIIENSDNLIYGETTLYRQAEMDKVCICVEPSALRDYLSYYYIPEDQDQEWIQEFMDTLPSEGKPYTGMTKDMKETGWKIIWQDKFFLVLKGGYLYDLNSSGTDMEYLIEAPKLCDYIQIMLQENMDYDPFEPADIDNIVSAKLDVCGYLTGNEFYSQTITDEETLNKFEEWFSNAEYILGGADCGNQNACLELTLESGEKVCLSIATDSCPNFGINGIYYDYRPTSAWDNREFFDCFDEIGWEEGNF